jgi:predicted house-cleaning NTP pyrophosphatase (Maf/HAM1 superfamily)
MKVLELANKKTPNSFIVACDRFVYIEDGAIKKKEPKEQQLMLKKPHQKP